MPSHPTPTPHDARPAWMLMAIALPVGFLLNRVTGGWDNLPSSLLMLMGWLEEPTALQRHAARVVSNLAVPGVLTFLLLKLTRLGAWLAPTRLALGCLLLADALLVGVALYGLMLAAVNEPPFMRGVWADVAGAVLVTSVTAGLATLLAATAWYRLVVDKRRVWDRCKALLREV